MGSFLRQSGIQLVCIEWEGCIYPNEEVNRIPNRSQIHKDQSAKNGSLSIKEHTIAFLIGLLISGVTPLIISKKDDMENFTQDNSGKYKYDGEPFIKTVLRHALREDIISRIPVEVCKEGYGSEMIENIREKYGSKAIYFMVSKVEDSQCIRGKGISLFFIE